MSSKRRNTPAVGFPPPLLGPDPQRLAILQDTADWIVLHKPHGVGTREHPWDLDVPDLDTALNQQLQAGKPELLRLGASLFGSVYYLEPIIPGIALFAKNRDALSELRNRFGSGEGSFRFRFVAGRAPGGETDLMADAPLLPHRIKPKMIPSTGKGKKCQTSFSQLACSGEWAFWEARAGFIRPHQVRAHAAVAGIPVMGDALYAGPTLPTLAELSPRKKRAALAAKPAYQGVPIRLCGIDLGEVRVQSDPDKRTELFLKRLGLSPPETGTGV